MEDPGRRHPHLKTPWQQCSRKAKSPGRVSYLSVFSNVLQYTVFQMIETKSRSFIHVINCTAGDQAGVELLVGLIETVEEV